MFSRPLEKLSTAESIADRPFINAKVNCAHHHCYLSIPRTATPLTLSIVTKLYGWLLRQKPWLLRTMVFQHPCVTCTRLLDLQLRGDTKKIPDLPYDKTSCLLATLAQQIATRCQLAMWMLAGHDLQQRLHIVTYLSASRVLWELGLSKHLHGVPRPDTSQRPVSVSKSLAARVRPS